MKTILFCTLVILQFSCTNIRKNQSELSIEKFKKDSLMQSVMYSSIDTVDGFWRITISKEKAIRQGVTVEIYDRFVKSVNDVNVHIDSVKRKDPKASIGYNFPVFKR